MASPVMQVDTAADSYRLIVDHRKLAVVIFKKALVRSRKVQRAVLAKIHPQAVLAGLI